MRRLLKQLAICIFTGTMLMLIVMQTHLNTKREQNSLFLQSENEISEERNFVKKDFNNNIDTKDYNMETTPNSDDVSESTIQDEKILQESTQKLEESKEYTRKYTATSPPGKEEEEEKNSDEDSEKTTSVNIIKTSEPTKESPRKSTNATEEEEQRNRQPESPKLSADKKNLKLCPEYPPELVGKLQVNATYTPGEDEAKKAGGAMENGCFEPTWCVARQTVAIIIPYKDRKEHLLTLMNHLNPILQRQALRYCIFVAEQYDNGAFNKARVMNALFLEITKNSKIKFDCAIFHDVDMLVEDDRNLHTCSEMPKHLSPAIDKFNYTLDYGTQFGGVTAISIENYIKVNGHSNNFWGWGGEDNDMEMRIAKSNLKIVATNVLFGRYKMIPHEHPWWFSPLYGVGSYLRKRHGNRMIVDSSGLGDIRYSVKFTTQHKLWTKLTIDIRTVLIEKAAISIRGYGDLEALEFKSPSYDTEGPAHMIKSGPAPKNCFYVKFTGKTVNKTLGVREKIKYGRLYKTLEEAQKICNEMQTFCGSIVEQMPGRFSLRATAYMHEKHLHYLTGMVKQEEIIEDHPTHSVHAKSCPGSTGYLNFFKRPIVMVGDASKGPSPAYSVDFKIKVFYDINTTLYYTTDIMTAHKAIIQEKVDANILETGTWDTLGNVHSNRIKLLNMTDAKSVDKVLAQKNKTMNDVVKYNDGIFHVKSPLAGILRVPGCYVARSCVTDGAGAVLLQWKWWFEIRAKTKEIEDEILERQLAKAKLASVEFASTVDKRRQMWLSYHEKLKQKPGDRRAEVPEKVLAYVRKEASKMNQGY